MRFVSYVILVVLLAALGLGSAYYLAGRATPPVIEIHRPAKLLGRSGTLDLSIQSPGGRLSDIAISVTQDGRTVPLLQLVNLADEATPSLDPNTKLTQESPDRIRLTHPLDRQTLPALREGRARIDVMARRPVFFGLRTVEASAGRDVDVRLTPPRLSVLSTHHYINHGGSEMVVYRLEPAGAESGVRVGQIQYRGFAATGAGTQADPSVKVAFFALLYDQDLNSPIELFARDEAGNQGRASFDYRVFPKVFRQSRIDVDTRFMQRVVPEIADHTPELKASTSSADELLKGFLFANGELRRTNAAQIRELVRQTAPDILWNGAFVQLGNSQVESTFADHRTYFFDGREIDRQVHLGFDLAVTANVPVVAANRGRVIYADYLGIYGNSVVLDHGMGVQSLYGHLSSIAVKPGQKLDKGQQIGRSGMTGLAGGDHLHFTMLVDGNMVSPVEWWDAHWIEDRVLRKLRDAGPTAPPPTRRN
ncbi:MAG: M23 family metallopeptidase [Acidobacteria bacterium]|nr:M23 family metallopeptidase [Acidobacteriota bacterium]